MLALSAQLLTSAGEPALSARQRPSIPALAASHGDAQPGGRALVPGACLLEALLSAFAFLVGTPQAQRGTPPHHGPVLLAEVKGAAKPPERLLQVNLAPAPVAQQVA